MSKELQKLAEELLVMKSAAARGAEGAQTQSKTMVGTVASVKDPLNQGRVQVIVDESNPNDAGQTSGYQATATAWANTADSFIGHQSELLVGQRVVLHTVGNDPNKLIVGNAIHDESSGSTVATTTMTRLPSYLSGQFPEPCEANIGCAAIELEGPFGCDWLCICLRRFGVPLWVRHIDLFHLHLTGIEGANDDVEPTTEVSA